MVAWPTILLLLASSVHRGHFHFTPSLNQGDLKFSPNWDNSTDRWKVLQGIVSYSSPIMRVGSRVQHSWPRAGTRSESCIRILCTEAIRYLFRNFKRCEYCTITVVPFHGSDPHTLRSSLDFERQGIQLNAGSTLLLSRSSVLRAIQLKDQQVDPNDTLSPGPRFLRSAQLPDIRFRFEYKFAGSCNQPREASSPFFEP
jgi:hypothetical protein